MATYYKYSLYACDIPNDAHSCSLLKLFSISIITGFTMIILHIIFLISSFTTGITANSYCDQQLKQLKLTTNKIIPLMILPSKLVVMLILSPCLLRNLLVLTKCAAGVEENGVPLVFSVILKQQVEDGKIIL